MVLWAFRMNRYRERLSDMEALRNYAITNRSLDDGFTPHLS